MVTDNRDSLVRLCRSADPSNKYHYLADLGVEYRLASLLCFPLLLPGHFNRALDMMNHAVAGTFQPGARENVAYFTSTERR